MRELLLGVALLVIVLILYYIFVYNRIVRLSNSLEEASSGIDIALVKRYDLISSLVEVVKGYSKHESDVFSQVVAIRNNLETARDVANEQMDVASSKLIALAESYPELKASEQYLNLQKNMSNVEEHLQASRRLYNRSVTELNNVVKQFPTSIIAKNHNIQARQLFATDANFQEKVEINFS